MADDLPTEFDLIVIGTGFTESVVAAAASRIGKNVLHLDPNDFYGCNWASFNLDTLLKYVDAQTNGTEADEDVKIENDSMQLINSLGKLNNIEQKWSTIGEPKENPTLPKDEIDISESEANVANDKEKDIKNVWSKETILKEFRKFNIDLIPKLLFSRGDLVELLISSNICRYAEFRAVDRVITLFDNALKSVPCSRSDVFTTKDVNVIEKRLLMKLLSNCLNFDDKNLGDKFQEYQNTTFHQYLKDENLTPHLIHYILCAISMSNEQTNCIDGIKNTKKFLSSLGRYGNTPFLFPMYGCGEIPQCFCRLCAVFGGVYCLKRPVSKINFTKSLDCTATDDNNLLKFHSIECDEQTILAQNIVLGNGSVSKNIFQHNVEIVKEKQDKHCGKISRAIFITDKPLSNDENINSGGGGVIFLKMQSSLDSVEEQTSSDDGAFVIQLSHFSGTCPKGLYLIHITCKQITDAATDLLPYVNKLFKCTNDASDNSEKPTILWSLYFNIKSCLKCEYQMDNTSTINSLHLCCGPYFELDYDKSILEAKNIFSKLYPNDEFLPRAPDPEEIIFGIGDEDDVVSAATDATNLTNILDIENNFDVGQLKENIADVVEAIENEEKCIEENSMNEIKGDD